MARSERRRSKRRRAEDRGPAVVLVGASEAARALEDALGGVLARQGQELRRVTSGAAAERLLHTGDVQVTIVQERSGVRTTVALLRRLERAAPGTACIVLADQGDGDGVLAYVNEGHARAVLRPPWSTRRLSKALRNLQLRRALARGDQNMRQALAELHELMAAREDELSRTNQELRKALREIGRKNRALTALNTSLRIQSTTDPLTGLYNRREFLTRIRTEWGRFRRYSRPLSLIMLDIDHFKRINDTYGHECGDMVLAELGQLVRHHKRAQDICCRYGGEEFVVVLPETSLDAAFHAAEDLRGRIAHHAFRQDRQILPVRVSLGVAGAAEHKPRDVEAFINLADKAMYRAKREGRDRTVVLDPSDESLISRQSRQPPRARRGSA